jgi:WD40 repeat protein
MLLDFTASDHTITVPVSYKRMGLLLLCCESLKDDKLEQLSKMFENLDTFTLFHVIEDAHYFDIPKFLELAIPILAQKLIQKDDCLRFIIALHEKQILLSEPIEQQLLSCLQKEVLETTSQNLSLPSSCIMYNQLNQHLTPCKVSPDGKQIAFYTHDSTIFIGNTENNCSIVRVGDHTNHSQINHLLWSPDSTYLASSAFDKSVMVWDTRRGVYNQPYKTLTVPQDRHSIRPCNLYWSPDGTKIAAVSWNKKIYVWDVHTETHLYTLMHDNGAQPGIMAWSPDGTIIASASDHTSANATIYLWNANTGERMGTFQKGGGQRYEDPITFLAWNTQRVLASGSKHAITLWHMSEQDSAFFFSSLSAHEQVDNAIWSPDGKYLLFQLDQNTLTLYDTNLYRHIHTFQIPKDDVIANFAWDTDNQLLIAGSRNRKIYVWETEHGHLLSFRAGNILYYKTGTLHITSGYPMHITGVDMSNLYIVKNFFKAISLKHLLLLHFIHTYGIKPIQEDAIRSLLSEYPLCMRETFDKKKTGTLKQWIGKKIHDIHTLFLPTAALSPFFVLHRFLRAQQHESPPAHH